MWSMCWSRRGERLDLIMIPKVGTAADVYAIDMLVTQIETAKAREEAHRLRAHHRDGARHAERPRDRRSVASATNRCISASPIMPPRRAPAPPISAAPIPITRVLTDKDEDGKRDTHWGDMWHYALARMVVAARANGLRPIDGPFGDFSDADGYEAAARRAGVLGCEGKWAIHPSPGRARQRDLHARQRREVRTRKRILAAMAQAQKEGKGAVALDGRLIDIASIRQAEVLVGKAEQVAAAELPAWAGPQAEASCATFLDFEKPIAELEGKIVELRHLPRTTTTSISPTKWRGCRPRPTSCCARPMPS